MGRSIRRATERARRRSTHSGRNRRRGAECFRRHGLEQLRRLTLGRSTGKTVGRAGCRGRRCAAYDHAVADNSLFSNDPASFGTKSLRISNARDGLQRPHVLEEDGGRGGRATAAGTRMRPASDSPRSPASSRSSRRPRRPRPGCTVVSAPDRGDGARMSWVSIEDTGGPALDMGFYDYQDVALRNDDHRRPQRRLRRGRRLPVHYHRDRHQPERTAHGEDRR